MSIERFSSDGPWESSIGYSRVVRAGDFLLTAGCTATLAGEVVHQGDAYRQALTAFDVGLQALARVGCSKHQIVQTRMYLTDRSFAEQVGRAHGELFGDVLPVATMLVVAGLLDARMLVEVELTAFAG